MHMQQEHVYGPYKHGRRWRVQLVVTGDGKRQKSYESFATESEAQEFREAVEQEIISALSVAQLREQAAYHHARAEWYGAEADHRDGDGMTVDEALEQYADYMRDEKGNKPTSITTTMYRLRAFFDNCESPLAGITPHRGAELYKARCQSASADTQRNELSQVKTFLNWCVERGWIGENPLAKIKPIGKRRRGKAQLRIGETRKLVAIAMEQATWTDAETASPFRSKHRESSLAVLVALYLGLRAGEIVKIRSRDLDDDGRLLWIPDSKTEAGKRTLKVPAILRSLLQAQADRAKGDRLFPHDRPWVRHNVQRLCKLADVPKITAHGLRGTHATLATQIGTTADAVARALGHTNARVTRQHYIADGATEDAAQERVMQLLEGQDDEDR